MAEFIYQMFEARKSVGDKVILDDVTLSFFPGAKIGVVGPNGMGKSTLLKVMAGRTDLTNGDARLTPGYTVGLLEQEPPLDEDKTVIENVRLAFGDTLAKIERFNQISVEMAEPEADFDALMTETCSFSTSPRTTSTPRASFGSRSSSRTIPAPSSPLPMIATSSITSPSGSARSIAGSSTPTRATTPPTLRPRRLASRPRARRRPSSPRASRTSSSGSVAVPRPDRPRTRHVSSATSRWRPRPAPAAPSA